MKTSSLFLLLAAFISATPKAEAGGWNIGKSLSKLGDAAANVITFGDVGRRRDEERARAERDRLAQIQAQAEKNKADKLTQLQTRARDLDAAHNDLEFIGTLLGSIQGDVSEISQIAQRDLAGRSWWKNAYHRITGLNQEDADFAQDVLNTLAAATDLPTPEATPDGQPLSDQEVAQYKAHVEQSQQAINRLRDMAHSRGVEMDTLLRQAVALLDLTDAQRLLEKATSAQQNLEKLKTYVDVRSAAYAREHDNVTQEITALTAPPKAPAAAPAPAPAPQPKKFVGRPDTTMSRIMLRDAF